MTKSCFFVLSWVLLQFGIINTKINTLAKKKIVNLSSTNKTHLKCDVIGGSVVNGLRETILFSFGLDEPSGYKVFFERKTIHNKK